ncbi:polyketide synthase dehydratase domain-containing protein, partial [Streptomyces sp. NPDC014894]|uniref:polyketide synthase dehydratase domain-containing protein n=1 Tax=Streptomyces sp. NPDC014894 TaxID=3364931 RepID=UPI0036FF230E
MDHTILGSVLLPGTAFVDLAVRAGEQVGCDVVEELTLEAPLVVPERGGVQVQLVVEAPGGAGQRSFSVHSRRQDALAEEPWTRHASGVLTAGMTRDLPAGFDELTEWPPAGAVPVDIEGLYEELWEGGVAYGPVFRGLRAAWRRGGELFTEVELPGDARRDAAGFGLHPALLDAGLHAIGHGTPEQMTSGALLPFSWVGVSLYAVGASSLRMRLAPHAVGDPHSLALCVADGVGRPVASVDSLTLRAASVDQVRAADGGHVDSLFEVEWVSVAAPAVGVGGGRWAVVGGDVFGLAGVSGVEVSEFGDLAGLGAVLSGGGAVPDVVFVSSVPMDASVGGDVAGGVRGAVGGALSLVQEWFGDERFAGVRLVWVTSGAVAVVPGEGVGDLAGAAVRGFLRSVQSENPGQLTMLDLDGASVSVGAVVAALALDEPELAVRGGGISAPRLARVPANRVAGGDGVGSVGNTVDREALGALFGGRLVDGELTGTVLVTGATGSLGGLFARHLVSVYGVRRLLLV